VKTNYLETAQNGLFEITEQVRQAVTESGIQNGIAVINVPHTTAGVSIISRMDDLGYDDLNDEMRRLIPTRVDFRHQFDTPSDAAGHIKCALIGVSVSVIIEDGVLQLGSSQGVFFYEFDGPRKRKYLIQIVGK